MHTQRLLIATVLVALSSVLVGCSDFAAQVRKVTYPPDFNYVSQAQLSSSMQELAYQLQMLNQELSQPMTDTTGQQQKVVTILRAIETIAKPLQAGEAGSNHPFLDDMMNEFVLTVGEARLAAQQNPPRYYQAGQVAGACLNCHKIR